MGEARSKAHTGCERRRGVRHELSAPAEFGLDIHTRDGVLNGHMVNISASGLCVRADSPLRVDDRIIIRNALLPSFFQKASVRWVAEAGNGYYMAGLLCLVDSFLGRLNDDIEGFIKNSIESRSTAIGPWSSLRQDFEPLRCREIKGCANKDCISYDSADYRCWLQSGTMCRAETHGDFAKKYGSCLKCDVFHIISQDPLRRLYENIDVLIYHLQEKAASFHNLAIIDPLTGLYNRHLFNEIIEREISRADRRLERLSFIMMDLDDFKSINDTLGHLTGDKVLTDAAQLIKQAARREDLAFRFGGDEFLVLMTKAGCQEAAHMMKRLQESIERWNSEEGRRLGCVMSISTGCATCTQSCDIQSALSEADSKMYENKKKKKKTVRY